MRKSLYTLALIAFYIVIWTFLTVFFMSIGIIGYKFGGFSYRFGSALVNPQLMLIAFGFTLLIRGFVYKWVFKQKKVFKKGNAIACIVLGCIWFAYLTAMKSMSNYIEMNTFEQVRKEKKLEEQEIIESVDEYIDYPKRKWLYDNLRMYGYNVGNTYEEFTRLMDTNEESRKWCWERVKEHKLNLGGTYDDFVSLINQKEE